MYWTTYLLEFLDKSAGETWTTVSEPDLKGVVQFLIKN